MASLRKIKGKYYIRVWIDGKEKALPTGTAVKRDAEIMLKKVKEDQQNVKLRLQDEMKLKKVKRWKLGEAIEYFEKNVRNERGIEESTVDNYKLGLRDLKRSLDPNQNIEDIKKSDYSILLTDLMEAYNPTTVNIRLRGIRTFFNYCLEKEFIKKAPFKVKQIKLDQPLPKLIMPADLKKIYDVFDNPELLKEYKLTGCPKMKATFKVYEATGMRLSEFANCTREGNFIRVHKSKGRKERIIPIPQETIFTFNLATDDPYTTGWISRQFTIYAKAAGIKATLHSLRHTYAARMVMETNNIQYVRDLLGHSSVTVTEIYSRFPMEYLKQIFMNKVS